ncbi:hypothetical protein L0F63_002714 [Massospora cicadina]|nr:hypothetical protein L0F63_002714 [Massospora cicadina]
MSYTAPFQDQPPSGTASGGALMLPPQCQPVPGTNPSTLAPYDRRMIHFQEFLVDWVCVYFLLIPGVNNDLLFCASPSCDVCIHQECYGVRVSPAPDEAWFCDRCRSPDCHTASCKLCPLKRGALKKLKDGSAWVHVVCALWWPQVKVDDANGLEIISIRDIPNESFTQRCILCESSQDSQMGACVSCDYASCPSKFHITCAQEWDLLEESTDVTKLKPGQEPYYAYCKQHGRHAQPQSVQERETPIVYARERRRSIQLNGFMLPPIESFNSLNAILESPKPQSTHVLEGFHTGLIPKFESAYVAYEKERSDFVRATEQIQDRQLNLLDGLGKKSFLSAQMATKLQREQQMLEQENRSLQLEVSELKYGLLNLCSIRGLRMIQKVMGKPKDGLEFYPHQDMILDYFLEVSHHIVHSNSDERPLLPPRSCICGFCGCVVDFSVATIACSVCNSWCHMRCIPSQVRPSDCTKPWICKGCQVIDRPSFNGADMFEGSSTLRHAALQAMVSKPGHKEPEVKLQAPSSPYFEAGANKRPKTETAYPSLLGSHQEALAEAQGARPVTQSPRFPGDEYTPRWVRGIGKAKEGLCPHCTDRAVWLKIKISAYWYHLNYQHGISSITGKPFRPPLEYRINPETELKEALCHKCRNWINSESTRNKPVNVEEIYWWKHAQKCHQ